VPEPIEAELEARCRGGDGYMGISGLWVFAFETVSEVSGLSSRPQAERVLRQGIAEICANDLSLEVRMRSCQLTQSPLLDESETCSSQTPDQALLAQLPELRVQADFRLDLPTAAFELRGLQERWGLEADRPIPSEPEGLELLEAAGIFDQDEDQRPGVTLRGDGSVPSEAWAVRLTQWSMFLQMEEQLLVGSTEAVTNQSILGGPATRLLRGRQRDGGSGGALFLRVDGLEGSDQADINENAALSCAEAEPYFTQLDPSPDFRTCR